MKILFISYYFDPFKGVGAKRVSYWANNIGLADKNIEVDVLTATKQTNKKDNVIYVEDEEKSFLSLFIKDEGVTWKKSLKKYFDYTDLYQYDIVLISGGPFMQFELSAYIKKHSNAKVVLDFRDPFYKNPRFKSSFIKDTIKKYYQNKFLKYTDLVITVNKYCAELIEFENIKLIDNGFDESISDVNNKTLQKNIINLISVGRIDGNCDMQNFFQVLKNEKKYNFNYVGNKFFNKEESELITHLGFKTYSETMNYIKKSDICVLFTSGEEFESTTKIFDYLALNKKILIITERKINNGALNDITESYPNILWSKNISHDIKNALIRLENQEQTIFDTSIYSRRYGLDLLINFSKELLGKNS